MTSLGVNAQSFANHLLAGIEAGGFDPEDFCPGVIKDKETGRVGFTILQNPWEIPEDFESNESHKDNLLICCFEDGIEWLAKEHSSKMVITEQQPPSMLAVLFLTAILTSNSIQPPVCPCCEAEAQVK